jgi:hypothetical protein
MRTSCISLLVCGCALVPLASAQPANDDCANAAAIVDGLTPFSTIDATTDGPVHAPPACDEGGFDDPLANQDVWFTYSSPCNGNLIVSTCNDGAAATGSADFDTKIAIYDGCGCEVSDANLLMCNDDGEGCAGFSSIAEATVTLGNCYLIRVGGFQEETGTGELSVECESTDPLPPFSPPSVAIQRGSLPDLDSGCCGYRYTIKNNNSPSLGTPLTDFYMEINKGDGSPSCESLDDIVPPTGFSVEFCDPWQDGRTVLRFFGGTLLQQESTAGSFHLGVSGEADISVFIRPSGFGEVTEQIIPAHGFRAWASQTDPGLLCGTGNFGPQVGQQGDWGRGSNGECPFLPIPALSAASEWLLGSLLVGLGVWLVYRSRSPRLRSA